MMILKKYCMMFSAMKIKGVIKFLFVYILLSLFTFSCTNTNLETLCKETSSGDSSYNRLCSSFATPVSESTPVSSTPTTPQPPTALPGQPSFNVTGTFTGAGFNGNVVTCISMQNPPLEVSQTLTANGQFNLTFNTNQQTAISCVLTLPNNNFLADLVISEDVSPSLKNETTLRYTALPRRSDATLIQFGNITYNGGAIATVSATSVSINGSNPYFPAWTPLSGVWTHTNNVSATTYGVSEVNNQMDIPDVTQNRWNQTTATDNIGRVQNYLSSWLFSAADNTADKYQACGQREGYTLPANWTAVTSATVFQTFSDPSINFTNPASAVSSVSFAGTAYGQVEVCGVAVGGNFANACDVGRFPNGSANPNPPFNDALGLNPTQCSMLCMIKSMDALIHFNRPGFIFGTNPDPNYCPFEYKTNLTMPTPQNTLAQQIPADGLCTPDANGNPCPGLILRPEKVLFDYRQFFEEAKISGDVISFFTLHTDTTLNCSGNYVNPNYGMIPNYPNTPCVPCSYDEKMSVSVRKISSTQAFVLKRVNRYPQATNNPLICDNFNDQPMGVNFSDQSFRHRTQILGFLDFRFPDPNPASDLRNMSYSQSYIMDYSFD